MMSKLLEGKKTLITGASSGIGKGIARVFAREGADIAFTFRKNSSGAEKTSEELKSLGVRAKPLKADIIRVGQIDSMIESAVSFLGGLDVMVNNAGITDKYLFLDITEQEFDELFSINCRGTFFCAQRAALYMKQSGGGNIINISSLTSRATIDGFSAYSATKAAINKFTETSAIELAPDNIRVNAVAAGWIPVEKEEPPGEKRRKDGLYHLPVGRYGLPEDIGEMCAFLASDRAGFITGQTFFVDGGQTCLLSIPSKIRSERFFKNHSDGNLRKIG